MHHEHRHQHERRTGAGAGQVIAIDDADAFGIQHETQADEHARQEEERQQADVVAGDVPKLRHPRRRVLQLQRVERIGRGEVESDRRRSHEQRRQRCQEHLAVACEEVPEQRQDHAAQCEPDHDDGDDPVAILGPLGDGEVPGERRLVAHRRQRHQEQRDKTDRPLRNAGSHGQTVRARNPASSTLKRAASSTNSAWPASPNTAI